MHIVATCEPTNACPFLKFDGQHDFIDSRKPLQVTVGEVFSWRQIADAIRELYPDAKLELGSGPIVVRGDVLEQKLGPLDYSLAKQVLGYEPKFKLNEGIRHFAQWLDAYRKAGK